MKKPFLQKALVLSGFIVLALSPFVVYFGTRYYFYDVHGCGGTVWSFCSMSEVRVGIVISLALLFVVSILFLVATLKKK